VVLWLGDVLASTNTRLAARGLETTFIHRVIKQASSNHTKDF